jgi:hypothetical protein
VAAIVIIGIVVLFFVVNGKKTSGEGDDERSDFDDVVIDAENKPSAVLEVPEARQSSVHNTRGSKVTKGQLQVQT